MYQNKPKYVKGFAELVDVHPYEYVNNATNETPIFHAITNSGDAWNLFKNLAYTLMKPDEIFYMDTASPSSSRPYIRSTWNRCQKKLFRDMSGEEINIGVSMLNEMIPIYNKYFEKVHSHVFYSPANDGKYIKVPVFYPDEE